MEPQIMIRFFMSRCAGETKRQYEDRLATLPLIPNEISNRPLADGIGYFYPDGTLYGYISLRK